MPKPSPERAPAAPEPAATIAAPPVSDDGTLPGIAPDAPPAFPPGADALDRVRAVLAAAPEHGMTIAEIAEAAHIARTTTSKTLARLAAHKGARRAAGGYIGSSRQPDRWHPVRTPAEQPGPETPDAPDEPAPAVGAAGVISDRANEPAATPDSPVAGDADPGAADGTEADNGPDTGPAAPAPPDTPGPAAGADVGPDTPHVAPDVADPATPPARATTGRASASGGGTAARLGAGALRQLVLTHLTTHPGQAFTPGEIGRALGGRSAGAVANACDKLTAESRVELTCEKPRRFRAVRPTDAADSVNNAPTSAQPSN
ncbi:hypothetical protein [Yinghuangia seranimata]|uniref:hypothetical protein n=1 Tax=Yinghuangia seranimata TaxID=408067 RepID=UPI00248C0623|nr:hypothetical protein [Yinghuangia seranimata]MDI2130581.1 hypothetical protein [Yinghuangia seranimata]